MLLLSEADRKWICLFTVCAERLRGEQAVTLDLCPAHLMFTSLEFMPPLFIRDSDKTLQFTFIS